MLDEEVDVMESDSDRCLARTRDGTPCQSWKMSRRNRCRMHGGTSTRPITDEGRKRALHNLTQYRDGKRPVPERRPPEYDVTYLDI